MNWFKVWTHCFLLLQKVQVQIHSASCKDGRRTRTHLHHQIRTKHPSESATHNRHLHALRQGLWTVWKTLGHRGHIQGMPWIFRYLKNRIYGENFNGFLVLQYRGYSITIQRKYKRTPCQYLPFLAVRNDSTRTKIWAKTETLRKRSNSLTTPHNSQTGHIPQRYMSRF